MWNDDLHSISRRRLLAGAAAAAGIAAVPHAAWAAYPDRLIKILVPQPAAGPTDIMGRIFAQELGEALKASTVVENKTGAGGNVPIGGFARAEADGYNLMVVSSVLVVNPAIFVSVPYDPINDFAPIAELGVAPNCIVVDARTGIGSMADLLAAARKEPGKLNYTSPGLGSNPYLAMEVLKINEKVDMVHIPNVGGGPALQATLAGTAQILATSIAPVLPYIQTGQLKPIVLLGQKRWSALPDVPTWNELGYKGQSFETFQSLVAPARTPPDILKKLETTTLEILARPAVKEKLFKAGFEVTARDTAAFAKRIAEEVPMWKEIVAKAGIKPR
jgi:tripartite-type tricarboxylate transporter receptor subunit TctC